MKRIALPAVLCVLVACSEAPTVPRTDLAPQFAFSDGDPTWYFEGVVDLDTECIQEFGKTFRGQVMFDDDLVVPGSGDAARYLPRMAWDVFTGGVRQQGSCAGGGSGSCGYVTVLNAWEDDGRYWDAVKLGFGWNLLWDGSYTVTGEDAGLLDDLSIPSAPPAGAVKTFAYRCPNTGLQDAMGTVTRLELSTWAIWANDPTRKSDCMKGGWQAFGFKNQGQCVRFVETGKDSR